MGIWLADSQIDDLRIYNGKSFCENLSRCSNQASDIDYLLPCLQTKSQSTVCIQKTAIHYAVGYTRAYYIRKSHSQTIFSNAVLKTYQMKLFSSPEILFDKNVLSQRVLQCGKNIIVVKELFMMLHYYLIKLL